MSIIISILYYSRNMLHFDSFSFARLLSIFDFDIKNGDAIKFKRKLFLLVSLLILGFYH